MNRRRGGGIAGVWRKGGGNDDGKLLGQKESGGRPRER